MISIKYKELWLQKNEDKTPHVTTIHACQATKGGHLYSFTPFAFRLATQSGIDQNFQIKVFNELKMDFDEKYEAF